MSRKRQKNSPGAVAAIGRASAHVAKAIDELRRAEHELEAIHGLGRFQAFITDVGIFKFLAEWREMAARRAWRDEGLRLVSETPEEGEAKPNGTAYQWRKCASCDEEGACWSNGLVWTCLTCAPRHEGLDATPTQPVTRFVALHRPSYSQSICAQCSKEKPCVNHREPP